MSNNVSLALLVLVSAAVGVGVGRLLGAESAPAAGEVVVAAGTEASLDRIEGALREILAEFRTGRAGLPAPSPGPTLVAKGKPPAATNVEAASGPASELNSSGPEGAMLPAAVHKRLVVLGDWDESQETRRRWLFTSDRRALKWFGAPDEVLIPNPGQEAWIYKGVDGRDEDRVLTFTRGRLTRID